MGITATAGVSLRDIRIDLDLPQNGRFVEQHVLNRVCKNTAPANLEEFRGMVLGTQLLLGNYTFGGPTWTGSPRWQTGFTEYIDQSGGDVTIAQGHRLAVRCQGERFYDKGMEARITGTVNQNGTYRFSGSSECRHGSFTGQLHIYLIAAPGGFLNGYPQDIIVGHEQNGLSGANGQKFWSWDVNLSTSKPYITAIFRNVYVAGDTESSKIDFWDWKLQKI